MSAHDARDDPARYGSAEGGECESDGRIGIGAGDMAGSLDLLAKAGMDGGRSSGVTSAEFEGDCVDCWAEGRGWEGWESVEYVGEG